MRGRRTIVNLSVLCFIIVLLLSSSALSQSFGTGVLRLGSQGGGVRELQTRLNYFGYNVTIDGVFGMETFEALKQFQSSAGLVSDGVAGLRTYEALETLLEEKWYMVQPGDSIYLLARKFGTTVDAITSSNGLNSSIIHPGDRLFIPGMTQGVQTYTIVPGDTLSAIAARFRVPLEKIIAVNDLSNPNRLIAGQQIYLPNSTYLASRSDTGRQVTLIWPLTGRISSPYGWRTHPVYNTKQFHGGIDIAVQEGTDVKAAASGRVVEAGWMGGYGLGIVIDHGSSITTWYGHNSRLLVNEGDWVSKGQIIAKSGNTGVSTGPHLDFRVKVNGKTDDPIGWLP